MGLKNKKELITLAQFVEEVYKIEKIKLIILVRIGTMDTVYIDHYPYKEGATGADRIVEIHRRVKPLLNDALEHVWQVIFDTYFPRVNSLSELD